MGKGGEGKREVRFQSQRQIGLVESEFINWELDKSLDL